MRLTISHHTEYSYDRPVAYALQRIRLRPKSDRRQTVAKWDLAVTGAQREVTFADCHGNETWLVSARENTGHVSIEASGIVETQDTNGVTGPHRGFAPLWLYLQETALSRPGERTRALAEAIKGGDPLDCLHRLMDAVHTAVAYQIGATHAATGAEDALAGGAGVCQDHAHVFLACARLMDIPARYVSGYLFMEGKAEQAASHAWAEAHVEGLGWVGFDCANKLCPDERYVSAAHGRDYVDAAPVSGIRFGESEESLAVRLNVSQ